MSVRIRTVKKLNSVPEEGRAIILYLTSVSNGVALALDFRSGDGKKTKRLLERRPRTEKNAIHLAKDLARITRSKNVYIIKCHDDFDKVSKQ